MVNMNNGEHKRIYEKVESVELQMVGLKKDTEFIKDKLQSHLKRYENTTVNFEKRIRDNEDFKNKIIGVVVVVSVIASILMSFIKFMVW